jgi:hypothetical protein
MLDIKDQMIEEQQDRRERMHQAVDDIEAVMHAQTWYMSSRTLSWRYLHFIALLKTATRVLTSIALLRDISTGVCSTRLPLWTAMELITSIVPPKSGIMMALKKLIPRSSKNANAVIPTRENTEAATS